MTSRDDLWKLLAEVELALPLSRDTVEALFDATFNTTVDHDRQPLLVAKTDRYELELRPPAGPFEGNMTVRFATPFRVGSGDVFEHFPDGHSLPPPPPGIGPPDLEGAYIANRYTRKELSKRSRRALG
jgi:hypothetical protein